MDWQNTASNRISKLSLYSLYYAEACTGNEFEGSSPRHCTRATKLLSRKRWSGGCEPLPTPCPIWPNLTPSAPETNALALDQLAGNTLVLLFFSWLKKKSTTIKHAYNTSVYSTLQTLLSVIQITFVKIHAFKKPMTYLVVHKMLLSTRPKTK